MSDGQPRTLPHTLSGIPATADPPVTNEGGPSRGHAEIPARAGCR